MADAVCAAVEPPGPAPGPALIRLVWADGGYAGKLMRQARTRLMVQIAKRSATPLSVLPRRWAVERTLA